jgi:hypothetical protein
VRGTKDAGARRAVLRGDMERLHIDIVVYPRHVRHSHVWGQTPDMAGRDADAA